MPEAPPVISAVFPFVKEGGACVCVWVVDIFDGFFGEVFVLL